MAASVTPPRGMRDFLPAEKARREHALGVIRGVYAAHGFDEIETPVDGGLVATARRPRRRQREARVRRDEARPLARRPRRGRGIRRRPLARRPRPALRPHGAAGPVLRDPPRRAAPRVPRRSRSRRCGAPSARRRAATASSCSATSTSSARPARSPSSSCSPRPSRRSTRSASRGCTIRLNDRRILAGILGSWGVPAELRERALITIDKLDKIGTGGRRRRAARARHRHGRCGCRRRARGAHRRRLAPARARRRAGPPPRRLARPGGVRRPARPARRAARRRDRVRPHARPRHGLLHGHDLRDRAPRPAATRSAAAAATTT